MNDRPIVLSNYLVTVNEYENRRSLSNIMNNIDEMATKRTTYKGISSDVDTLTLTRANSSQDKDYVYCSSEEITDGESDEE